MRWEVERKKRVVTFRTQFQDEDEGEDDDESDDDEEEVDETDMSSMVRKTQRPARDVPS